MTSKFTWGAGITVCASVKQSGTSDKWTESRNKVIF